MKMSSEDDLSKRLRFSRRQVTRRPFVLPSVQIQDKSKETDHSRAAARQKVSASLRRVVSHNRSRDNADLTKSSPLAVLVEQDENSPPANAKSAPSSENGRKKNKKHVADAGIRTRETRKDADFSSKKKKVSQVTEETPPPPPVEVSYLASTPKPGKQQLLRQRSVTSTGSSHRSGHKLRSTKQISSSTKLNRSNVDTSTNLNNLSHSSSRRRQLNENRTNIGTSNNLRQTSSRKRQIIEENSSSISSITSNNFSQPSIRKKQQNKEGTSSGNVAQNSNESSLGKRRNIKESNSSFHATQNFNESSLRKRQHNKGNSAAHNFNESLRKRQSANRISSTETNKKQTEKTVKEVEVNRRKTIRSSNKYNSRNKNRILEEKDMSDDVYLENAEVSKKGNSSSRPLRTRTPDCSKARTGKISRKRKLSSDSDGEDREESSGRELEISDSRPSFRQKERRQAVKQKKTQKQRVELEEEQEETKKDKRERERNTNMKQINNFLKDLQSLINMC